MSLRNTYYFDTSKDSDIEGVVFVSIVPKRFWEKNGYMADQTPTELHDHLEPFGFYEAMECVFEFEGTREEAEAALLKAGLVHNKEFSAFLAGLRG